MSRVTLAVYDRAGVLVATDNLVGADGEPAWWVDGDLVLDELDDTGTIQFNVQVDATDVADISPGHIVVVSLDAAPIWRGVIRKRVWREVAEDEAGRYVTFTGVGEVGRLEEIIAYPTGGLGRFPFSDDVSFNWTHPSFDDGAWDFAVETPANYGTSSENFGLPEGFPWGSAEWIWDVDVSGGSIPAEVKYFRKAVNVATAGVFEAWSAADDRNEVFLHGTSILKSSDAPYDGRTTAVELFVTAGWVQVAATAENRNTLKAGLLAGIGKPLEVGDTPIVVTDDTWLIAPDGAELGMNAGQIADIWLDEYEARLTASGVTPTAGVNTPTRTWTSLLDSAGNAWSTYEQITVPVGTTMMDLLRQMVELEMCDFRMSPDGFTLNLYNAGGAGSTVAYTLGDTSLVSLTWESAPAVSTALLTRWARGWTDEDDAGLVTEHGRIESMLSLGGVTAEGTAQVQALTVIGQFGDERVEIAADIDPAAQADEPYTKYEPGDSIQVPGPSSLSGYNWGFYDGGNWNENEEGDPLVRVLAVAMGVDEAGNPTWAVHLNSHLEEIEKRQQLLLKRLAGGSVAGRSQNSTIPYEPRPIQPREPEPVEFSQDGGLVLKESGPRTFTRAVRVREVHVEVSPASTAGDVVVTAQKNGVVFATVTVTAGRTSSYEPVTDVVFQQRADVLTVETTSIGADVESLTAKVIYA